jgi:hypothetical protein
LRRNPVSAKAVGRVVIIVFLVLILVSEILLYTPALSGRLSLSVEMGVSDGRISGNDTIRSPVAADVRQSLYLVHQFPQISTVYLYFDTSYPWSYSNPVDWYGISAHIETVSDFRGVPISVVVLSASQLPGFLTTSPAPGTVLIVASGVLPDTVFTKSLNLVAPWVKDGGILVWMGDRIGTYSGQSGVPLKYPSPLNPGANGTREFLNLSLLGGTSQFYNSTSMLASAFNLNYTLGIPFDDLNTTRLPAYNGTSIGNLQGGFTNLAIVPLGSGEIIYFGGPTEDATNLGLILTNLLETGLYTGQVVLVNVTSIALSAGSSIVVPFSFPLSYYPYGAGSTMVCSFFTQTNYLALFGQTNCIPLA